MFPLFLAARFHLSGVSLGCDDIKFPTQHHPAVPCLKVPHCADGGVKTAPYVLSDGSGPAIQATVAEICYSNTGFTVSYSATDNNVYSKYPNCHDQVWEDDALEFMIYPGLVSADPIGNYTELDISPKSGFWAGAIHNPSGFHPVNTTLLPCNEVTYHATLSATGWAATLHVPFSVINYGGGYLHGRHTPQIWRANFYRTDRSKGSTEQEFSAWSANGADPPNFHIPRYFGILILETAQSKVD